MMLGGSSKTPTLVGAMCHQALASYRATSSVLRVSSVVAVQRFNVFYSESYVPFVE